MAQVADVIDRVVRQLLSGTVEERNKLSAAVNTSATTLTCTYSLDGIRTGSVIEVGAEQMYVWDATVASKTLTVERGFNGTTPSTHAANAILTVNPRFPRNQIVEAINAELDDLSSPVNGLYRVVSVTLDYNGTDDMVDFEGASDVLSLQEVRWRYRADDYPRVSGVELVRDVPVADFPSGLALRFTTAVPLAGDVIVSYKTGFAQVASESDDLQLVSGLPQSCEDIIVLGAQVRLIAPRETKRNFTESQGDTRRAEEVPPQSVANSLANLQRMRRDRITAEAMKLTRQYPIQFRG